MSHISRNWQQGEKGTIFYLDILRLRCWYTDKKQDYGLKIWTGKSTILSQTLDVVFRSSPRQWLICRLVSRRSIQAAVPDESRAQHWLKVSSIATLAAAGIKSAGNADCSPYHIHQRSYKDSTQHRTPKNTSWITFAVHDNWSVEWLPRVFSVPLRSFPTFGPLSL